MAVTVVATTTTAFPDSARSSASAGTLSVVAGDILWAVGVTEQRSVTTMSSVAGGGLVWSSVYSTSGSSQPHVRAFAAEATGSGDVTPAFTASNGTSVIGGFVWQLRQVVATTAASHVNSQSTTLSTTAGELGILVAAARPGGDITGRSWYAGAGAFTEVAAAQTSTVNMAGGHHPELGAAASVQFGVSGLVGSPTAAVLQYATMSGPPPTSLGFGKQQQGAG